MNTSGRYLSLVILIQVACLTCSHCLSQRLQTLDHKAYDLSMSRKKLVAVVFLSPECPICQNYTLVLSKIQERFKADLDVLGVFPGKAYPTGACLGFRDKYHIRFLLVSDTSFALVKRVSAKITPEVFLMDRDRRVLYHGAIDNWVAALGKQRSAATEHYLEDGIKAYLQKVPILIKVTKPVGCYINEY